MPEAGADLRCRIEVGDKIVSVTGLFRKVLEHTPRPAFAKQGG